MSTTTFFAAGFVNFSTRQVRVGADYKAVKGTIAAVALSGSSRGCLVDVETAVGELRIIGRLAEAVDNTGGAAGALSAEVDFHRMRECIKWKNSAIAPLTLADLGASAYVESNDTVSSDEDDVRIGGTFWGFSDGFAIVEPPP